MPYSDPEKARASSREANRRRRVEHPDEVRAYQREYYAKNIEKKRAYNRDRDMQSEERKLQKRLALHTYRIKHAGHIVRARAKGSESYAYAAIILKDPCAYCGEPSKEIDHIDAVTQGGTNEWDNLTPSCVTCNRSKQAQPLVRFLLSQRSRSLA